MMDQELSQAARERQSGVFTPDVLQRNRIVLIGAGSIGSYVALGLAKTGYAGICCWDPDTVELSNVGSQLYGLGDIEMSKVHALDAHLEHLCGFAGGSEQTFCPHAARVDNPFTTLPSFSRDFIFVVAVDTMRARLELLTNGEASLYGRIIPGRQQLHYVDVRSSFSSIMIEAFDFLDENQRKEYAKTLYTDEEALVESCRGRATAGTVITAAGLVVSIVNQIALGRPYPHHFYMDLAHPWMSLGESEPDQLPTQG